MSVPTLFSKYTLISRVRDFFNEIPGKFLFFIKAPGFVHNFDYPDKITGDYIKIKVTQRFTIISVNNRDYWFRRGTGKFDGTGYACPSNVGSLDCRLDYILESIPPPSS